MEKRNDKPGLWNDGYGEIGATLKALENAGVTSADLKAIRSDKKLAKGLAEFIKSFGKTNQVEEAFNPENFNLKVDYSRTLEEMIADGKYDWVNSDFTAKNFPIKKGEADINCKLFHSNRYISSDKAIKEMDEAGYREATQAELLALGATYPELQRQFPIVALGSIWRSFDGFRCVPCLGRDDGKRMFGLSHFEDDWADRCRFLAVRKNYIVNLKAKPSIVKGFTVEEHIKGSESFELDMSKLSLYLSPKQISVFIDGNELKKELDGKKVMNANLLDYLLEHQELIPEDWKGNAIFFWGTIYRDNFHHLCVRYLIWDKTCWIWDSHWLSKRFMVYDPALIEI